MVPQAKPGETAEVIRDQLERVAMAAVTDEQVERVRALVASIPPGPGCTYGDIASAAGLSSPRIVGWIMRTDSSDLPWHRVIPASGRPAAHLATVNSSCCAPKECWPTDGRDPLTRGAATTF